MGGVPDSVATVNLGGEAVPRSLADKVYALPGVERLYNVYGPSEDTTFSTWALIDRTERAPSFTQSTHCMPTEASRRQSGQAGRSHRVQRSRVGRSG